MLKLYTQAQMKTHEFKERAKEVMTGKRGMTMLEITVLIAVILLVATALFALRNVMTTYVREASTSVQTGLGSGITNPSTPI